MNDIINNEGKDYVLDNLRSIDIKLKLEQWPLVVAILGVCVTYSFVSWVNK